MFNFGSTSSVISRRSGRKMLIVGGHRPGSHLALDQLLYPPYELWSIQPIDHGREEDYTLSQASR